MEETMLTFSRPQTACLRRIARSIVAAVLITSLAACGGGSGGYGSGGGGSPMAGPGSKLFAADSPHMAIGSVANLNPAAGTLMVDRII
jgi:hypothetical protein